MYFGNSIEFPSGIKYDLSVLTKTSLIESYNEYKEKQKEIRNKLILQNEFMKQKYEKENKTKEKQFVLYHLKRKMKNDCILDLSQDKVMPKGYFCYPINVAYFQKSSFEMNFFPLLSFNQFQEGIDTFDGQKNISETYLSYPCLPQKDYIRIKNQILMRHNISNDINSLNNNNNNNPNVNDLPVRPANCTNNMNKYFIIWSFIKILKGQMEIMDQDFLKVYRANKDGIIVSIIKEMSKYLKIEINILYHIIKSFLSECQKKINKDSLTKKGISYRKYEKYWCRICNRFFCAFHFKIKVKTKKLNNGNIRTTYEYLKKIQITLRPPEYLFKEQEENDNNKKELKKIIQKINYNCDCCNFINLDKASEQFTYDESLRFNKMSQIKNKEDFFILCKVITTSHKLLTKYFGGLYTNDVIYTKFFSPCVFRIILHNKYDCDLLRYLIKLILDNKYPDNINFFLKSSSFLGFSYETLSEENLLFFNNTIDLNIQEQKFTDKGEQKIVARQRTKGTARLQIQSEKNLNYKPCDHYPAECTKENCTCAKIGRCLKYCCCFKEQYLGQTNHSCKYMFLGCETHASRSSANCSTCSCFKFNIECVPGICSCGVKCTNNNITLGKRKKLIYGYSYKIKGGGLFAGEDIKMGEFVDIYCGEIVEKDELDRLSVFYDQTGNNYPFCINDKFDFVAIKCGGLTRYINHASFNEENIKADKFMVNGVPYIAFYAFRNIKKYEELFYDYSYEKSTMPDWMKEYNKKMKIKIKKEEQNRLYHKNKYNKKQDTRKRRKFENVKEKEKEFDEEDEMDQSSSTLIYLDEDMDE